MLTADHAEFDGFDNDSWRTARHIRPAYARWAFPAPPQGAGIVSGRREVEEVLRQPDVYAPAGRPHLGNTRPLCPVELAPPEHTAWRAALEPLFAPMAINGLAKAIATLASELVDGIAAEREVDFCERFSLPFPTQVLMALLGLPADDLPWILDLVEGVVRPHRAIGKPADDPEATDYRSAMSAEAYAYFGEALDHRQKHHTDDLLSQLLTVKVDGQRPNRDRLLDVCFTLLIEGIAPMSAALDCIFALLAERRGLRRDALANPRRALEELLRWESPVMFVARTATTDAVRGGCPIAAGQRVVALLDAANIDPVESEDAGVLRLDRDVNRHLAFGLGAHRCLGSHLARQQILVALREWHARIPDYTVSRRVQPGGHLGVRTFDRLQIEIGKGECE
jgi:cytochrome P450